MARKIHIYSDSKTDLIVILRSRANPALKKFVNG